jgi:hypothetical protein
MKCQLFWGRHFSKAYHGTTIKHTLVIVILLYVVAWKGAKMVVQVKVCFLWMIIIQLASSQSYDDPNSLNILHWVHVPKAGVSNRSTNLH